MILNCVVIPDTKSSQIISNIMHSLSEKCNSTKALDFVPHFSIRNDFEINDNNVEKMKSEVIILLKNIKPFTLNVTQYGFYPWKIVYLDIEVISELQRLHNELMETIQKYRTPMVTTALFESKHFQGKQRDYIERYGYQFAFEYYSPHFTVAGNDMSDTEFEKLKHELENQKVNIVVTATKIAFMNRKDNNSVELELEL